MSRKIRRPVFIRKTETVSIEKILEIFRYQRVLVFKVDIEGGEYAFLTTDKNRLCSVDIFLVEIYEQIVAGYEAAFETVRSFAIVAAS